MGVPAVDAFKAFNWDSSEQWQSYLKNIYPPPPAARMVKYKKKWYKAHVDPDFDLNCDVDERTTQGTATASSQQAAPKASRASGSHGARFANPGMKDPAILLQIVGSVLVLLSVLSSALSWSRKLPIAALLCLCAGFFLDVYATLGKPSTLTDAQYWQSVVLTDSAQGLMLAALGGMAARGIALIRFLPIICVLLNADSWLQNRQSIPAWIPPAALKGVVAVRQNRYRILETKATVEVMLGFTSILGLLTRSCDFLSFVMYWNYLRFAYMINGFTRSAFGNVNQSLRKLLSYPAVPASVLHYYDIITTKMHEFAMPPRAA